MFARTLTLTACILSVSSAAQAQTLLNPMSWFGSNTGYNNCANGNCAPRQAYSNYPTANCPNGNCGINGAAYNRYPTANCTTGNCPQVAPYYGGAPNGNYGSPYAPATNYNAYRPVTTQPVLSNTPRYNSTPVRNAPFDPRYSTPTSPASYSNSPYGAPRQFNSGNSPFYP